VSLARDIPSKPPLEAANASKTTGQPISARAKKLLKEQTQRP